MDNKKKKLTVDYFRKKKEKGEKIVALTAYAMKGDDEKCFEAGCDNYISKPIEQEKLIQILNKYLSAENIDICRHIDSAKSDVDQLNRLCSKTAFSDSAPTEAADKQYDESPVDFEVIKKIYDDEEVLKETIRIFLEEAPFMPLIILTSSTPGLGFKIMWAWSGIAVAAHK